jgi:hypothetical protein
MAISDPSLPPKILTGDELRPGRKHTPCLAADGCHLAAYSRYVLLVIIGIFFLTCATQSSRELSCINYRARPVKSFAKNFLTAPRCFESQVEKRVACAR